MNDCVFCWIDACNCPNGRCDKYISVNSNQGNKIAGQYQSDIDKVIEPIREQYKKKYLSN